MSISMPAFPTLGAILLPQNCFLCGSASARELLCRACLDDLPQLPAQGCPLCALPTPSGAICGACLKQPPHFDATYACFRYAFPVDRLIQALKFQHCLAIGKLLADALLDRLPDAFHGSVLLALPLAAQRLHQRGFNQAIEIARPLACALHIPLVVAGYARTSDTVPQSSLPWKERQKNIRGAFECSLDLSGKQIIVVDDVMTTGATLNEFARTLKKHGANHVTNCVVARALKD